MPGGDRGAFSGRRAEEAKAGRAGRGPGRCPMWVRCACIHPSMPSWCAVVQGARAVHDGGADLTIPYGPALDKQHATSKLSLPPPVPPQVTGAKSDADARVIARSVAGSSLAKSAIFGHDPNWGRIAAAAGYSGESRRKRPLPPYPSRGVSKWANALARVGSLSPFLRSRLSTPPGTKKKLK